MPWDLALAGLERTAGCGTVVAQEAHLLVPLSDSGLTKSPKRTKRIKRTGFLKSFRYPLPHVKHRARQAALFPAGPQSTLSLATGDDQGPLNPVGNPTGPWSLTRSQS